MTQLLLFDTPSTEAFAPLGPVEKNFAQPSPAADPQARPQRLAAPAAGSVGGSEYRPGVHRMGDLARLLLLRHDLVAQRRSRRRPG